MRGRGGSEGGGVGTSFALGKPRLLANVLLQSRKLKAEEREWRVMRDACCSM